MEFQIFNDFAVYSPDRIYLSASITGSGSLISELGLQSHTIRESGFACRSVLVPTVSEQNAHRYSYLSPCGNTKRSRLRTGTACLQRGQYSSMASNSLYASTGSEADRRIAVGWPNFSGYIFIVQTMIAKCPSTIFDITFLNC